MKSNVKHLISNAIKNTVLIFLTVLLLLLILGCVVQYQEWTNRYSYTYVSFSGTAEEENYAYLENMAARNEATLKKPAENTADYIELAKYIRAAVLYKAYTEQGKTEQARYESETMEKALTGITEPEVLKARQDVDKKLENYHIG